jgi:hypothetical protein
MNIQQTTHEPWPFYLLFEELVAHFFKFICNATCLILDWPVKLCPSTGNKSYLKANTKDHP